MAYNAQQMAIAITKINAVLNDGLKADYKRCTKLVPNLKGVSWEAFSVHMPKAAFALCHIEGGQPSDAVRLPFEEEADSNGQRFCFTAGAISELTRHANQKTQITFGTVVPAAIAYSYLKLTNQPAKDLIAQLV